MLLFWWGDFQIYKGLRVSVRQIVSGICFGFMFNGWVIVWRMFVLMCVDYGIKE